MITLACIGHSFTYELEQLARMFLPGEKFQVVRELTGEEQYPLLITQVEERGGRYIPSVRLEKENSTSNLSIVEGFEKDDETGLEAPFRFQDTERLLGLLLYRCLRQETGIAPPWGILTGVRPVRLCRQWAEAGLDEEAVYLRFTEDYIASPQKIKLTMDTARNQSAILAKNTPDSYSLYISIPFCPTRCLYCSFVSSAVDRAGKLIPEYIRLLEKELEQTARQAEKLGLKLHTIYMGGGTPTSLEAGQLEQILRCVQRNFDTESILEYTVEAGRPDTITREKLEVLRKFGVDRISINPQTMDDTILKGIGRAHSAKDVEDSYSLAREMGFTAINMDLIAGLPGESRESFTATLDKVLSMNPENITLHTLTVKRSSSLRDRSDAYSGTPLPLNEMLATAQGRFGEAGYSPYYLYRQKGTVQNLENTGFSRPGFEGVYNVYSMEEVHTILAVGAGAVTKLCRDGHIQRVCNFKYPYEYIGRFDELLARKSAVEGFYETNFGEEIHPR